MKTTPTMRAKRMKNITAYMGDEEVLGFDLEPEDYLIYAAKRDSWQIDL